MDSQIDEIKNEDSHQPNDLTTSLNTVLVNPNSSATDVNEDEYDILNKNG